MPRLPHRFIFPLPRKAGQAGTSWDLICTPTPLNSSPSLNPPLPPSYDDPLSTMERGCSPFCTPVVPLPSKQPLPTPSRPATLTFLLKLQEPPSAPSAPPAIFLAESDEPLDPGDAETLEDEAAR